MIAEMLQDLHQDGKLNEGTLSALVKMLDEQKAVNEALCEAARLGQKFEEAILEDPEELYEK
jgi:hypothetical protein